MLEPGWTLDTHADAAVDMVYHVMQLHVSNCTTQLHGLLLTAGAKQPSVNHVTPAQIAPSSTTKPVATLETQQSLQAALALSGMLTWSTATS